MKRSVSIFIACLLMTVLTISGVAAPEASAAGAKTPVALNGQLSIKGTQLVNQNGKPVQLKGISSHGLQWFGDYVNKDTLKWLRDDWGITVFRAAMYTADGGYIENPSVKNKVKEAVEAAKELGIYVIIDWHILNDGNPNQNKEKAKEFFKEMSSLYGSSPNVIYEIANEPNGDVNWKRDIKPYAEEVISVIRKNDPDNIIITGTGTWSQDVNDAADDQLKDANVMYALHFYAGTHGQFLRDKADYALSKGAPIFVTEWGTSDASGNGGVYLDQSREWLNYLDSKKISWVNWNLSDKQESSSALKPGASKTGGWPLSDLSASGTFVRENIRGSQNSNEDRSETPKQEKPAQENSISVQYRTGDGSVNSNQIRPQINVKNSSKTTVNLKNVTVRYWYNTKNKGQNFDCDYAKIGCSNVAHKFVTLPKPVKGADAYLELGFRNGTLSPGASTGEIQIRLHNEDWSNYSQAGDYSFFQSNTFKDTKKITLYNNGKLIWGTEPK
ncbi:cellulase family glycosylhydrolase [Bacillus halotolerans]|uniref:cellulase family glycosylhydrolase n=1 Tax=Bacillus halotolerans TaxID=260554 RepID=UPI0003A6245B|nr:cellulase family glycosylhydrolase [Bacillus halotolerans]MBL4965170.1 cellulase family glycosylhydrolase [Bacillus halotolerans]MDG3073757.1 cellulase family glycosylhydrolase [Bacillus halotolerans]MEC0251878.1 cellulase family glycosylhydrolase [Bacillus halotolerans]MEC0359039.1 cellulase family glycosylhydrolase [Bacillus halotolerans]UYO33869.1 cellulase family glycosylhydrolase [Bacillus halotolerans]